MIDFPQAAHHHLTNAAGCLGSAETPFNEFALLLRDGSTLGHGLGRRLASP